MSDSAALPPAPRHLGAVNWLGLWTLYRREVQRFVKILGQTVLAPVITTLLFLAIFSLALGRAVETVGGVPFLQFLAPGLVIMATVQNAFSSTSSALIILKIQGNIVDLLMAPLSPGELTFGFAVAGLSRGIAVGLAVCLGMWLFVPLSVHDPLAILFYGAAASLTLSLLGIITGIWGNKFDHIAFVTNFIVTPFAFLSGTFYSVERLPGVWHTAAHANPFFYMIDGFRYGFTGHADGSLFAGAAVLIGLDLMLWLICYRMVATGYNLKS